MTCGKRPTAFSSSAQVFSIGSFCVGLMNPTDSPMPFASVKQPDEIGTSFWDGGGVMIAQVPLRKG